MVGGIARRHVLAGAGDRHGVRAELFQAIGRQVAPPGVSDEHLTAGRVAARQKGERARRMNSIALGYRPRETASKCP